MVTTHSERDAARHYKWQNYRADEKKPFDHCFPLPAVLAVRDLVLTQARCDKGFNCRKHRQRP
jgi:hypothetical protein